MSKAMYWTYLVLHLKNILLHQTIFVSTLSKKFLNSSSKNFGLIAYFFICEIFVQFFINF